MQSISLQYRLIVLHCGTLTEAVRRFEPLLSMEVSLDSLDIVPKNDRNGVQVIARAAAILRVLKDRRSGLSLGQIATAVDLPRSTVQRIITALARERLVVSGSNGIGVRLGPELGALGRAVDTDVVERCHVTLSEVARVTGETTDLAVLRNGQMIFLDQVPGRHRLRTVSSKGEAFPLTVTANGRACLALMPEDQARKLITKEWAASGTDGKLDDLLGTLDDIRDQGLAYDLDEHTPGISAVGFAFQDPGGNYHAISVPAPSMRFRENLATIEEALKRARTRIDEDLM